MFAGYSFVYDNIPSEVYKLRIGYINQGGTNESTSGSDIEIISDKVRRNPEIYYYGSELKPTLEFNMSVFSDEYLDSYDRSAINKWLFGRQGGFKDLKIIQQDMEWIVYKCILNNPTDYYIGNRPYCKKFKVICNAPWAYTSEITKTYTITDTLTTKFNNLSDHDDYLYPKIVYKLGNVSNGFSITNVSDNNSTFTMNGLTNNEILTIDCKLGTITSSLGLKRLSKSNYKFLKLLSGFNTLKIVGTGTLSITCSFPKKIGG